MRQATQTLENAITIPESFRATAKLTAYKSRIYFDTYTNNAPVFALPDGSTAYPTPEAIIYDETIGKFVTIAIEEDDYGDGQLAFLIEGSSNPIYPTLEGNSIAADPRCRPGIFGNRIFYYDNNEWKVAIYDSVLLGAENPACINSVGSFSSLPTGAIYPIGINEAVLFYIDEGSVRPVFIASDATEHKHPGRLINPIVVLSEVNDADVYALHYSGAVKTGAAIYIYFTAHDGSVKTAKYKLATNEIDGSWSDYLVAVPEDLSIFEIGNVFVHNDRFFMCGKFYRKEDFESNTKYTLLLWSDDGKTFSIDRRTLVSLVDLRFLAAMCGDEIAFSASNRYNKEIGTYRILGEAAPSVNITLDNTGGSASAGWTANVKASDELYLDNEFLDTGTFSKLEIGVYTASGLEWIKYHDVVIARITKSFEDGIRGYELFLMPDALWHISVMTHPFYMEVQGKQAILDKVKDFSNLYSVSSDAGPSWTLSCDFWSKEAVPSSLYGLEYKCHAGNTTTDHWCNDIKDFCQDYPVLDDSATIEVRIYGWSRAGIESGTPESGPPDPTPTNSPNDDFYALLLVEDEDGAQSTIVSLIGELSSAHSNPPQTYFPEGAREGSYPVTYLMANPGAGKKIIKVGARIVSGSGNTVYYPERVELPGIAVELIPIEASTTGFEIVDLPLGTLHQTAITNTIKGIPQILFSQRPFSAWNFDCDMRVQFKGEYTSVGPLGLGSNKDNFILGYISKGKMGIAKIRGGQKTILLEQANGGIAAGIDYDVRFWHRDGLFGLEVKKINEVWPTRGSQLTYSWQEADGTILAVDDIFHVGAYGFIDPPRFRTTGFRSSQSIVPVLPLDMDDTSLDSDFETDFPTSGTIDIDGIKYSYSGKNMFFSASNPPLGPFQLRNYSDWQSPFCFDPGGGYAYQGGMAIEIYLFKWLDGATHSDDLEGAIIATNAGMAWINQNTQWKAWITTVGQVVWARERSRHYSAYIPDYHASCSEKVYITNGLTGVAAIEASGEEVIHSEGTFVYIHSEDEIIIDGFYAASGDHDNSISSLLDKFCRVAGTMAILPGDFRPADGEIGIGEEVALQ